MWAAYEELCVLRLYKKYLHCFKFFTCIVCTLMVPEQNEFNLIVNDEVKSVILEANEDVYLEALTGLVLLFLAGLLQIDTMNFVFFFFLIYRVHTYHVDHP